jgi:hypothetical protein
MLIIPLKVDFVPRRTAWLCHALAAVLLWRLVAAVLFPELEDVPLRAVAQAIASGDPGTILLTCADDLLRSRPRVVHLLFAVILMVLGPVLENRLGVLGLLAVLVTATAVTPAVAAAGWLELPANFDLLTGTALGMAGVSAWLLRDEEVAIFYFVPYASLPCFCAGRTATHVAIVAAALVAVGWFTMMWPPGKDPGPFPHGYIGGPFWALMYPMLAALVAFALESLLGERRTGDEDSTTTRPRRSASAARP